MSKVASKRTIYNQNQVLNSKFIVYSLENDEKLLKMAFEICISTHDPPYESHVVKGLTKDIFQQNFINFNTKKWKRYFLIVRIT